MMSPRFQTSWFCFVLTVCNDSRSHTRIHESLFATIHNNARKEINNILVTLHAHTDTIQQPPRLFMRTLAILKGGGETLTVQIQMFFSTTKNTPAPQKTHPHLHHNNSFNCTRSKLVSDVCAVSFRASGQAEP